MYESKQNDERFKRIELILGKQASQKLKQSYVAVIGLGAVGSYAVEGLARAGIGRFKLVDFDRINISNINRQLYALDSTIGMFKCDVAKSRVLDINPRCKVEAINGFVDATTANEYLADSPDIIIDAIDSLNSKVELIAAAQARELRIITCLGAALRTDPSRVKTGLLEESYGCPLGRLLRKRLKKRGIPMNCMSVFSDEPVPNPLPIAPPADEQFIDAQGRRGRPRNALGSLPTITGIFGLTAANLAINMLIN